MNTVLNVLVLNQQNVKDVINYIFYQTTMKVLEMENVLKPVLKVIGKMLQILIIQCVQNAQKVVQNVLPEHLMIVQHVKIPIFLQPLILTIPYVH